MIRVTAPIPIDMPESCFDCPLCDAGDFVSGSNCLFTNVISVAEWREWGSVPGEGERHPKCPLVPKEEGK